MWHANCWLQEFGLKDWHTFLVYVCFCLVAFLTNAFLNAFLATLNKVACKNQETS